MGAKTNIEWTDASWNPIAAFLRRDIVVDGKTFPKGTRGWLCTKVSPGCANCYAERINFRLGNGLGYVRASLDDIEWGLVNLDDPLRWKRPRMIFVCSMCDLFHEWIPNALIDQVFAVMALARHHTFQVLTKRAFRMKNYLSDPETPARIAWRMGEFVTPIDLRKRLDMSLINAGARVAEGFTSGQGWPLPNIWPGVSAENQEEANRRILDLLETPAAVRVVSAEPLLGPINLNGLQTRDVAFSALEHGSFVPNRVDQVIVGGESGPGARPMHPDWARRIRDDCTSAGVAFFFKQWGEWAPLEGSGAGHPTPIKYWDRDEERWTDGLSTHTANVVRIGKKRAGRVLDGRTWSEYPQAASILV
jgi:protein gp37